MNFENKAPKWDAAGAEPSEDLQKNGFLAGYKPPAPYFNFLFHVYTKCINELQALLKAHGEDTKNPHDVTAEQVGARPNTWTPTASDVGAITKSISWVSNVDLFEVFGTADDEVTMYKFGSGCTNTPDGWSWFSVLKCGSSAFAFGANYKGVLATSRYTSEGWSNWVTTTDLYLPLIGGTLSGKQVLLYDGYVEILGDNNEIRLVTRNAKDNTNTQRSLELANSNAIQDLKNALWIYDKVNGTGKTYHIFGQHNKVGGSYTGNGSATQRTINVGGIGYNLVITSDIGTAWVSSRGAICLNRSTGEISGLKSWECYLKDGVLTIATNSELVNKSSQAYWYDLL